jgi:Arc/MetJ-type ribon-helix-helix transcriptional regulator
MKEVIQARLDPAAQQQLDRLVQSLGWSASRVVREGIRLLAACQPAGQPRQIIGLGKFASGIKDLGSSKRHLRGFGR